MLENRIVVVAGGTGNVGTHITRGLLDKGATVVVPSRSAEKLAGLRDHLSGVTDVARLHGVVGDLANEKSNVALLQRIESKTGAPHAVIASLGRFRAAPSLLDATSADIRATLDDYLMAHFVIAKLFLKGFADLGGNYVFVNGPLAFSPWEGTGLVSIATAAQQLLFQSLAKELAGSKANVIELVNYAFIRDRATQPCSVVSGEAVGDYAAYLVSDAGHGHRGKSIHVDLRFRLEEVGM